MQNSEILKRTWAQETGLDVQESFQYSESLDQSDDDVCTFIENENVAMKYKTL